jgi:membrane protein DedA with SNARE-associated domain
MLPVCIVGVLTADVILCSIGRYFGTRLLAMGWFARMVSREKHDRIERNFDRYGVNILLVGRLLPGIRSPLFITAGTMRLPVSRFVVADALGAVVGNSLLFFLAFWFGDQFRELVKGVEDRARPLVVVSAIVAVGVFFVVQFLRRPVPTGDPEELPIIGHQVATHIETAAHKHADMPAPPEHAGEANGCSRESLSQSAVRPRAP